MPVFEYRGLSESGKPVTGLREADTAKALRVVLRKDGVFLTDVVGTADGAARAPKGAKGAAKAVASAASRDVNLRKLASGRISTEDIAITTRQLATLLGAGVTLVESLTALVDQVEKDKLKRVLSDVKQRVNEGSSLADALNQHVKVFGNLYVNMIRAGESSGALDAVLLRLADFTEGQARLRQKVVATLIYPVLMAIIGGGILTLLMTTIVPKIVKIFDSVKATLPWNTRLLIWTSNFLQDWWFILFPALIAAAWGFRRWTVSEKGKPVFDAYLLRVPILGALVRLLSVSRFARTLATLLKSGVPLLGALEITRNVVSNTVLAEVIDKTREAVREGESLANPLKKSGQFPPLVHHMISVGERSGQLEDMLVSVADNYESQVNTRIGALTALMEPLMIVVMGVVIGFVALSIILPMMQLNSVVTK